MPGVSCRIVAVGTGDDSPDVEAGPARLRAGPRRPPAPRRSQGRLTMAMDQFIKIGALKGEAKDSKHKDEIDVLSWNWGVSNSGSAHGLLAGPAADPPAAGGVAPLDLEAQLLAAPALLHRLFE